MACLECGRPRPVEIRCVNGIPTSTNSKKNATPPLNAESDAPCESSSRRGVALQHKGNRNMLKSFIVDESGASLVEYGLLVGLIAVVAITAVSALGTKVKNVFATVNNTLNSYNL